MARSMSAVTLAALTAVSSWATGYLRRVAERQSPRDLSSDMAESALERCEGILPVLIRAEDADKHLRVPQVIRHLRVDDSHKPDPRILQLLHNATELAVQALADLVYSVASHITRIIDPSRSELFDAHFEDLDPTIVFDEVNGLCEDFVRMRHLRTDNGYCQGAALPEIDKVRLSD